MPTTPTARRPDTVRAVIDLSWTTALVVAIPWALAVFFGWPFPRQVPDWSEVVSTPIQLIDPTVILNFFVCLAWLCWFVLMGYLVVDAVDVARGLGQRVHRLGPLSGVAAKLVAAAVLLASLRQPTATSFAANPPTAITQVIDLPAPPTPAIDLPEAVQPSTSAPAAPTYVVARGDSLWAIAEAHLGSGFRWHDIYNLNRHQIHDPDYIDIG